MGDRQRSVEFHIRKLLKGFDAAGIHCPMNKYQRCKPFSRAMEFQEVLLLEGGWNQPFQTELTGFPDAAHDDQVDAAAGAFNFLSGHYSRKFKVREARIG